MNAARWAAAGVVGVTLAMNAGVLFVSFATDFMSRFIDLGVVGDQAAIVDVAIAVFVAVSVSYVAVGFLLAGRPGAGRIAAVLLGGGAVFAAVPFGYSVGSELVFHAPQSAFANAVFLLGPMADGPGFALILPGLALVFPTGRIPSRRWALPVGLAATATVVGIIINLFLPGQIAVGTPSSRNPFGIEAMPAGFEAAAEVLDAAALLGFTVLGIAAVLTRYRSGDAALRHQLRWFIAAVLLTAVPLPISIAPGVGGPQWFALAALGLLLVPVSVGIAVTRYRLYEIDRLISRTIGWALVTGALVAVFVATVIGLEALLGRITQGETLAVAASTLVAFALFQPLRRRIQAAVDRRFDRAGYDAQRTAIDFAAGLRDQVDLSSISNDIADVVETALRPSTIGVWLREPEPSQSRPGTP
jgi:hypothetical protein